MLVCVHSLVLLKAAPVIEGQFFDEDDDENDDNCGDNHDDGDE